LRQDDYIRSRLPLKKGEAKRQVQSRTDATRFLDFVKVRKGLPISGDTAGENDSGKERKRPFGLQLGEKRAIKKGCNRP